MLHAFRRARLPPLPAKHADTNTWSMPFMCRDEHSRYSAAPCARRVVNSGARCRRLVRAHHLFGKRLAFGKRHRIRLPVLAALEQILLQADDQKRRACRIGQTRANAASPHGPAAPGTWCLISGMNSDRNASNDARLTTEKQHRKQSVFG